MFEWWLETPWRMAYGALLIFGTGYWCWMIWYINKTTYKYDSNYEVDGYTEGFFGRTYIYKRKEK